MNFLNTNMRIGPLIFAILVFVLASTNGAIMYTSYVSAREQLENEIQRSFEQAQKSALNTLWEELNFLSASVELVTRDGDLGAYAKNAQWSDAENFLYFGLQSVSDRLDILLIADTDGRVVGNAGHYIDNIDLVVQQVRPVSNITSWVTAGKPEAVLVHSIPIIYHNTGQVVGYMIYGISLRSNLRLVNEIQRTTGIERVELFANDILQTSAPRNLEITPFVSPSSLKEFEKNTVTELDDKYIAYVSPLSLTDQAKVDALFVIDDTSFGNLADSFKNALTIHSIVVLVGSASVFVLLMWLVINPAKRMSRYALSVVGEDEPTVFEPSLISEFNTMGTAVERVFKQQQSANESLTELKNSLQQQVVQRTATLQSEVEMRAQAEMELRKLVQAVEQSPTMIFITDLEGRIEYVNTMFSEITGYTREEAVGRRSDILKSPDTPKEVHADLWKTIMSGAEWRSEIKDRRKDGSYFWAYASIAPVHDLDGNMTHFVAMHEDISERKMAEEHMRDAKRTAELANRAKTELMANMSHELRTPLNAILGFSSSIEQKIFGPIGDERYEEYIGFIHSSGAHLLDLINDILDVSAIEAGKLELHEEPVHLSEVRDACQQIIQPRVDEGGLVLQWSDCKDLPTLMIDERRMKQILLNLLSNAVKFTPRGGRIVCDAKRTEDGFVISVEDTGIGMDEEGLDKAMMQFGQVDSSLSRKHDGSGLGLPLTKSLVELHGGTFEMTSQKHKGTIVTITLPLSRVLGEQEPEPAPMDETAATC